MKRIGYALDTTLESLESTAADWGNWADVYQFVQSPNQAFVNTNITAGGAEAAARSMPLLIVDLQGNLRVVERPQVSSRRYEIRWISMSPIAQSPCRRISRGAGTWPPANSLGGCCEPIGES